MINYPDVRQVFLRENSRKKPFSYRNPSDQKRYKKYLNQHTKALCNFKFEILYIRQFHFLANLLHNPVLDLI